MRKAFFAMACAVVAVIAGCGSGGSKSSHTTTREGGGKVRVFSQAHAKYADALNKICTTANHKVAKLRLTTALETWKGGKGHRAVAYTQQAVSQFKALTPPKDDRGAAKRFNAANGRILADIKTAAAAADAGKQTKFHTALAQQRTDGAASNAAAAELGSPACS